MFEGRGGCEAGRGTVATAPVGLAPTAQPGPADARPAVPGPVSGDVDLPVLAGRLGQALAALEAAVAGIGEVAGIQECDLPDRLAELAAIRQHVDRLVVAVAGEGIGRGVHNTSEMSATDWLGRHLPHLTRRERVDLALVGDHMHRAGQQTLKEALTGGHLRVDRAAKVLRCTRQVRPLLSAEEFAVYFDNLTVLACDPGTTDAELARVSETILSTVLPEVVCRGREQAVHDLRGVNESSLADGSLTRFIITADPEGTALLRAVLTSPLAAPSPDATGPDPRTATQRRYDALLTVLGRGVTSPDGVPTTGKARVMVTIPLTVLQEQTEQAGLTLTGDLLPAGTLRKLACSAELIPAVLGTDSEILDLARPIRYASPGQLTALYHRDRHCTYPGCTIPAQWCDAHHVIWYSRGGKTYYLNLALLCGRHHTLVHRQDLTATITPTGVTWHLK